MQQNKAQNLVKETNMGYNYCRYQTTYGKFMYLLMLAIIVLISGSLAFLRMYLINRPVRSFLYISIFAVLAATSFIFKAMNLPDIGLIIFIISQLCFIIACIRGMTIESGYFNYLRQLQKGKPLYKRFLLNNYFVVLKEDKRNSKTTVIKWGMLFILLFFISIMILIATAASKGINIKEPVIGISIFLLPMIVLSPYLLLGIGLIYYSRRYLESD